MGCLFVHCDSFEIIIICNCFLLEWRFCILFRIISLSCYLERRLVFGKNVFGIVSKIVDVGLFLCFFAILKEFILLFKFLLLLHFELFFFLLSSFDIIVHKLFMLFLILLHFSEYVCFSLSITHNTLICDIRNTFLADC